ncbi:MAG: Mpv17/PMP22 family protein [bacterium]
MKFRKAFQIGLRAARANLLPGLLLQGFMLLFLAAYLFHDGTHDFLNRVGEARQELGYEFSLATYIVSGALLPELLRICCFQSGRPRRVNFWNFLTAAPLWAAMGMMADFFYRCQNDWFGTGNSWQIIAAKVLVDQFLYSPFLANPLSNAYLAFRTSGLNTKTVSEVFSWDFALEKILPTQFAGWCVWIPGVSLVYFMPPLLQLPTAVLIQCFWVLLLTTLHERRSAA